MAEAEPATDAEIAKWERSGGTFNFESSFTQALIARIRRLEAAVELVRRAAQDSTVTTSDEPGCFYCDHEEHTPICPAKALLDRI